MEGQTEDIHLQLTAGFFHRHILDGAEIAEAGVVHQYVDAAFIGQNTADARLHGFIGGDVQRNRHHAEFAQRFHPVHATGGAIDLMPIGGEVPGR